MRLTLKNIVKNLLREAKEEPKEAGEDSLDAQVDKLLIAYESEAKNAKTEGRDFRSFTRRFLREAEEDEEDKKDEEGEEEAEAEKPKTLTADDINLQSFVADVMRLIDNYDSLLEVRNTILRRATNYLAKNYEKDVPDSFKAELMDSYGIEIGKSDSDMDAEFAAPKAGAAGPAGGSA